MLGFILTCLLKMAYITSINVYYQVDEVYQYQTNGRLLSYFLLPPYSVLLHRQGINPVRLVRPVYPVHHFNPVHQVHSVESYKPCYQTGTAPPPCRKSKY